MSHNATFNYGNRRGPINCTYNARELREGIKAQEDAEATRVAEHEEFRRVKKGKRTLIHRLPTPKSEGYVPESKRPTTKTTRIER